MTGGVMLSMETAHCGKNVTSRISALPSAPARAITPNSRTDCGHGHAIARDRRSEVPCRPRSSEISSNLPPVRIAEHPLSRLTCIQQYAEIFFMDGKSASRTLDVLELFAREQRPLTLSELAAALDAPVSSCFNLVRALKGRGFLFG